jgi:hypothetical protein
MREVETLPLLIADLFSLARRGDFTLRAGSARASEGSFGGSSPHRALRSYYAGRLMLFTKITEPCNHAAALKRWATRARRPKPQDEVG